MTPPQRKIRQAVRLALQKQVLAAEEVIQRALEYAGCPKPDEMARYFMVAQASGGNGDQAQIMKDLMGHEDVISSSTASNRIKKIQWRRFMGYINEALILDALEDLRRRPPDDGKIHLPTDPHFENYRPKRLDDGEAFTTLAKAYYAVFNPKHNKRAPHAIPYLAIGVAWRYQGNWTFRVVHVELLEGLQVNNHAHHCRIIRRVAKQLGHDVGSILLDAWYDATKVRNQLARMGYTVIHRMRFGEHGRNLVWIDGQEHVLQDVARDLVHDPGYRAQYIHRWGADRKPTRFLVKQRILLGHLGAAPPGKRPRGENGRSRIQLQVALKEGPRGYCIDWAHTSAIVMHSNLDRFKCRFIYHVRWTIETLFQVLESSKPTHKEQLIAREVVNFLTLVLLTSAMSDLRITLSILYPGHRAADRLLRDIAIRTWISCGLTMLYFR